MIAALVLAIDIQVSHSADFLQFCSSEQSSIFASKIMVPSN